MIGSAWVDFVLGAALIALPQHKVPLLLGTALVNGVRHVAHAKRREHAPPEAENDAGEEQVELEWRQLDCVLTAKKGGCKHILKDLQGRAPPGRLLAIMGPSGGGKTTLLNALAGQLPAAAGLTLSGVVTVNGRPRDAARVRQAYVQQEDLFYSQLTVWETLMMAARLRLPADMPDAEKQELTEGLITRLGLAGAADTVVGDEKTRGLSGGERKRLSIGMELLGRPRLLFCDEPTSGLDSFQAEKVMATLRDLARDGRTVVASIHQPRSSIFAMFDDLVLLSEGAALYAGPADGALAFFAEQGHVCPEHYNPAEFLADLISVDPTSSEAEAATRLRVAGLRSNFAASSGALDALADGAPADDKGGGGGGRAQAAPPRCAPLQQVQLLFSRSWRQISRDRATNIARAASNVSSALIFGGIFWRMGRAQSAIQDRMGLLQVAAINAAMSSLVKTLNVFPKERTIVQRERAKGSYGVAPYFASKLAAESPISALFPLLFAALVYPAAGLHPRLSRFAKFCGVLTLESFASTSLGLAVGSFAPSTDAALAIGPGIMVLFIVFGGYYVNEGNVPRVLRWVPSASLIKHGFEGLCAAEFPGLAFEPAPGSGGQGDLADGDQVLRRLGFEGTSVAKTANSQARVILFNYWVTYCILKARKPRFARLEPPRARELPGGNGGGNGGAEKVHGAAA
ncbi:hypothetical protein WJX81_003580 [Elliptochloris bilobata]|uniref:ABC transporter domain-containing protein n=1 Tax=Elliptochloris bilobata TaxID=381761 RepID=A0AAW1R2U6_9CHLO